jgi:pimeloyl-ACP methyl ester carboxylesterase
MPHARALAARYHVVTADLPGHGALVDTAFTATSIRALLDDVLAVCERPPLVVGYSLGGYVAMTYAARFPERTQALLLDGCTMEPNGWKLWPPEIGAHFAAAMPSPFVEQVIRTTVALTLPRDIAAAVNQIPFNRDVIAATSRLAREMRFAKSIAAYPKPVLFANGEFDLVFRMDEQRFMASVPQAQLRIIRRTDHTAPMRRAQEFTAIVDDFAQRVFATPAGGR